MRTHRLFQTGLLVLLIAACGAACDTGATTRISVSLDGDPGNQNSLNGRLSATGRFVVFGSFASNLLKGDTNQNADVFVRDVPFGKTSLGSVSSEGKQANNGANYIPAISADGRYVAFASTSDNLVANDHNGYGDIFVHDNWSGKTSLVSVSSTGEQANLGANEPCITAGGRFVAFASSSTNLIGGGSSGEQIFVHDRLSGETRIVSVSSAGDQGNNSSFAPDISGDGRYVTFTSSAWNLVPNDTNGTEDIFVHDCWTGETRRVSVSSVGEQGNGQSYVSQISADGRFVCFMSFSTNLVLDGDQNGPYAGDAYVYELETGEIARASVSSSGEQGNAHSYPAGISYDGRYVSFNSQAWNLVEHDWNGCRDDFVHDRETGVTIRVSVSSSGQEGDEDSIGAGLSGDGRCTAFSSGAKNMIDGYTDPDGYGDVFLHQMGTDSEFYAPNKVTILKGTHNSGTLQSLAADDDDYWIQGAGYDPTDPLAVINSSLLCETNVAAASYRWCSICFVTKCNNLSAKYRIQALRADGSHVTLAEDIPARAVESVLTPLLPNPVSDFIDAANGNKMAVEICAASSNRVAGFFKHYIDQVEWELVP